MLVRLESNPLGPRLFVLGRRVHHFHLGTVFVGLGVRWVWRDRVDAAAALGTLEATLTKAARRRFRRPGPGHPEVAGCQTKP